MAEAANITNTIATGDSIQASVANEASNESLVNQRIRQFNGSGDNRILDIADDVSNLKLYQCSFCHDKDCNVGDKTQHWTGDVVFKLQDPQYTEKCPLLPEFVYGNEKNRTINLSKIVDNLPDVVEYIREPSSSYKELGTMLRIVEKIGKPKKNADEHTEEIDNMVEELKDFFKDDKKVHHPYTNEIQEYSLSQTVTTSSKIHFIDCEYMLQVSIPRQSAYSAFLDGKMFTPKDHKTTEENKERDKFRWIFIPSSDRFGKNVILDRSRFQNKGEMLRDDTLCFVVVRENQFAKYREQIGNKVPIIQLPEIVIGVGYARFWIIKIAKRFQLEHIWMIDDSVDFFKEYIPIQNGNRYDKDPNASKQEINRRCPSYCFNKMESIMGKQPNLVAISPRKYTPRCNVTYEFSYKPIQSVMLLNITKITEKNINFRPELRYMEDMIFSQECTNAGLELCTWNAILFVDKKIDKTGANTTCQSPRGKTETGKK